MYLDEKFKNILVDVLTREVSEVEVRLAFSEVCLLDRFIRVEAFGEEEMEESDSHILEKLEEGYEEIFSSNGDVHHADVTFSLDEMDRLLFLIEKDNYQAELAARNLRAGMELGSKNKSRLNEKYEELKKEEIE